MQAIELVMKIWGIDAEHRAEVEDILANTATEHMGLALANLGACADRVFQEQNDAWMEAYFPELKFA